MKSRYEIDIFIIIIFTKEAFFEIDFTKNKETIKDKKSPNL